MSDNQFSRSLPERPSLEHLRNQAKTLLRALREEDKESLAMVAHFERDPNPKEFRLQDAQRVLARSYGFSSWTRLKERVIIQVIKSGDTESLAQAISTSNDPVKLITSKISDQSPTNHAIGKDATLLQFASFRRWQGEDMAAVLLQHLDHGASVDLHSACGMGMTDRIAEIISANADAVNEEVDTYFPVQYAISAAQADSIRSLMQHGDDPNRDLKKVAYFGWEDKAVGLEYTPWKPIHMASLWGFDAKRVPVAQALVEHGADPNAVSPLDGFRPIHLVAMPNRVDMIRFFVAQGVDVDSRSQECQIIKLTDENDDGPISGFDCTPLMVACAEGFIEATQCLLELGADVNVKNSEGKTPLDFAEQRMWPGQPYDQIIESLVKHGAKK